MLQQVVLRNLEETMFWCGTVATLHAWVINVEFEKGNVGRSHGYLLTSQSCSRATMCVFAPVRVRPTDIGAISFSVYCFRLCYPAASDTRSLRQRSPL